MEEALIKRIPPHSQEAERSVIGSMLMSEDAAIAALETLTKEDFYDRQNGILFDAMRTLNESGRPIDLVTLSDELKKQDLPEEFGTADGLVLRLHDMRDVTRTAESVQAWHMAQSFSASCPTG